MCKVSSGYSDLQSDGISGESDKLIQGVIETIDLAKTQRIVLSQLDDDLQEALAQVRLVSISIVVCIIVTGGIIVLHSVSTGPRRRNFRVATRIERTVCVVQSHVISSTY